MTVRVLTDIVMVVIGSYGAYTLFSEFIETGGSFSIRHILVILQKRWYAAMALMVAFGLFFVRIYYILAT